MKIIALIPARYAASRFPGKLLKILGDKPIIAHTYFAAIESQLFDEVAIVTDHEEIKTTMENLGAKVYVSKKEHECGTDRIAEFSEHYNNNDIIINIQGDEPFTNKSLLKSVIEELIASPNLGVVSIMTPIKNWEEEINNPNVVKVVVNYQNEAMLFSRSPIPYHREKSEQITYYKHIGIYGFRQHTLLQFSKLNPSTIEKIEKQEAMRFLENGIKIGMIKTNEKVQGIDTPEDLNRAIKLISKL